MAKAADGDGVTPMMAQYIGIKEAHAGYLLFYRMGDFYELFLDDAEVAAKALGIALTKRGKHQGADIPMCGVPVERSEDYLHRLIARGHRVAVCEQVEDPAEARLRGAKSVVRREVVRLVTPGTVTEDGLLEPGEPSRLVAVARPDPRGPVGVASVDITTGCFTVAETPAGDLDAMLSRLQPREVVADDALVDADDTGAALRGGHHVLTRAARRHGSAESAARAVREWYGVATLDGFGAMGEAEVSAASVALSYVARTQIAARPNLRPPERLDATNGTVGIDAATRNSLELTRTLAGERKGSLLHAIDATMTPAGSRLLAERLAGPITDVALIAERLDAVARLHADHPLRSSLRKALKGMPDLSRATSRLALGRGGPRDLAAVRDGLATGRRVAAALDGAGALPSTARAAGAAVGCAPDLLEALTGMLADDPPPNRRDGGFVRPGHDPALDAEVTLRDETRTIVAALQARYVGETGMRTLRIKHNGSLGYFVEVPQASAEALAKDGVFHRRQGMSDAVRFTTDELADLDRRISAAGERALQIEQAAFDRCAGAVAASSIPLNRIADAVAEVDVTCSLAEVAASRGWTRPMVDGSLAFVVRQGRHPVVEAALQDRGESFVPNDCDLSGHAGGKAAGGGVAIVTGPNMAGKSTFLRQNALLAILAQCGSFVPAGEARIGVVDQVFSRVGASDDLARGRSTFMVEMVETAAILNRAGPRSLVVMDEIGRGTATWDGLALAWAAVEHIHHQNRSRTLFATHYHELTALSKRHPRLVNLHMRVNEFEGEVAFAHEVAPGAAGRSYGIHVAKLAGMPPRALERARDILEGLEGGARKGGAKARAAELPLFDFAHGRPEPPPPRLDPALAALDALDPEQMSPREAMQALFALKEARAMARRVKAG